MKRCTFFLPLIGLFCFFQSHAQFQKMEQTLLLSLRNVEAKGDYVDFDVYMRSGDPDQTIYLGHTDVAIRFDPDAFENPVVTKLGNASQGGTCTFTPHDASQMNTYFTRLNYFNAISTKIKNDQVLINVSAPSANSEEHIKRNLAKVDQLNDAYRLASFRVTGFKGGASSTLKLSVPGTTKVRFQGENTKLISKSHTYGFDRISRQVLIARDFGHAIDGETPIMTHVKNEEEAILQEVNIQNRSAERAPFEARIFPNPASEILNIEMSNDVEILPDQMIIVDIAGKLVYNSEEVSRMMQLNIRKEKLQPGYYQVHLLKDNEIQWQKEFEVMK